MTGHRAHPLPAVLTLAVLVLAGCASPGGGASARNDVAGCAGTLPLARTAVHGRGALTLVRTVNRTDIGRITDQVTHPVAPGPHPAAPTSAPPHVPATSTGSHPAHGHRAPKTCLVVYRGDYPPGALTGAMPAGAGGQYALIVLRARHPAIERILVAPALPPAARRPWWHF